MKILEILKNCFYLFLLFLMDQIVSVPQIIAMYTHPNVIILVLLVIVYAATATAVIIFLIQFYQHRLRVNHSIYGNHRINRKRLKFMILMVVLWAVFLFLQTWYTNQFGISTSENQSVINQLFKNMPVWTFIDGVVIAPIMEELIFRGLFFELFFRKNERATKVIGVIVNGIMFGALHDTGLSFPIYALMGILLAWTYVYTKDVKYGMAIHVLNNFIAFL